MIEINKLSKEAAQVIGAAMGVNPKDILSKRRGGWEVSDARFILFAVMAENGYEYREIGRAIGKRDRTTVLHGVTQLKKRCKLGNSEKRLNRALVEVNLKYPLTSLWD